MDISLEISTETALALHHLKPSSAASMMLQNIAQQLGVVLTPMHPGINDPDLIKSFFVEVATEKEAESVISAFLKCPDVEGAYAKPEGKPP